MFKEIVLKSCNPEEYPDEVIVCRVIANEDIGAYVSAIPEEKRFRATKVAPVEARAGKVGEEVKTVLYTERNGRRYILSETTDTVGERKVDGQMLPDVVVTNVNSTSNEQYIVKSDRFSPRLYAPNEDGTWTPQPDERLFYQVDEDIIIMTAWGAEAVCLRGSYIVEYNAEENDYNTVEKGAEKSTYKRTKAPQKTKKDSE